MLGCPHRLAGGLLSILPSDRAGGAAVLWITAFFVARVVVLVRHTVGSGVRGEWGGEQRAPLTLHVLSTSSAEQGPHKPVPSQGADKEAGREDRHGGLQVSLAPLLRPLGAAPLAPGSPQFCLRYPGSRGHAGAMGTHGAEGEALGWGRGVRHTDERTEVPWGTAGHSTLLEHRQPGK